MSLVPTKREGAIYDVEKGRYLTDSEIVEYHKLRAKKFAARVVEDDDWHCVYTMVEGREDKIARADWVKKVFAEFEEVQVYLRSLVDEG